MIPYNDILEYSESKYPEEACGLLVNRLGEIEWMPCENIAEDKTHNFRISGVDYIKANIIGDVHAIVHSHPDSFATMSEEDIKASDFLKVPYLVVSLLDKDREWYYPSTEEVNLIGRTYIQGKYDCWSLVQDYYKEKYNTILIPCDHATESWRDEGFPSEYIEEIGFEFVKEPKEGDIVIFSVMSKEPNHAGIYLGGNVFMHHADNRLSCREPLQGIWMKYLKGFLRCKKFI